MQATQRERFLAETAAAKERAESLLRGLIAAHAECESHLVRLNRKDPLKAVTGKSALDNAVAATRRMIESLERAMQDAMREIGDEEMAVLDEVGA
jgi:hypothetical protein